MSEQRYWIIVVSKDHLERGKELGIVQANHGKPGPMKRLQPGELIVFYSPKQTFAGKEPCRKFTAIALVKDGEAYLADMGGGFTPYRRDVEFLPCAETDIVPLLERLSFIKDPAHWGYVFRFGFFEIPAQDFATIAQAMGAEDAKLLQ